VILCCVAIVVNRPPVILNNIMRINARNKGKRIELQLAKFLCNCGFKQTRRGVQFQGGPSSPDVVCPALPHIHIECKGDERVLTGSKGMEDAFAQATRDAGKRIPVVMWKHNRGKWNLSFMTDYGLATVGHKDITAALTLLNREGIHRHEEEA
jgi:Holliday junction resolvase